MINRGGWLTTTFPWAARCKIKYSLRERSLNVFPVFTSGQVLVRLWSFLIHERNPIQSQRESQSTPKNRTCSDVRFCCPLHTARGSFYCPYFIYLRSCWFVLRSTCIPLFALSNAVPWSLIKLRKIIAQIRKHWLSLSQKHKNLKNCWFVRCFKDAPAFARSKCTLITCKPQECDCEKRKTSLYLFLTCYISRTVDPTEKRNIRHKEHCCGLSELEPLALTGHTNITCKATSAIHLMPQSFAQCWWCGPTVIPLPRLILGKLAFFLFFFSLFYALI